MAEFNNSFVFYRSFYDAMKLLDNDDKSDFINLICELAFNGVEPDFKNTGYSDLVKVAYTITAEQIKASIKHKINGARGGTQKGINNKNSGLNSGVNSPLNTNVNVNEKVNVNVKENDNVNGIHTFLEKNNLKDFFINYGYKFVNRTLDKIAEVGYKFDDPQKEFIKRLEYINKKYKDKTQTEKQGLFYSSLSWETIPEAEETKEKKPKKINLDFYKTAPKICDRCGSKIEVWAGVPKTVICNNCRTFWEFDEGGANVWKCSRGE